MLLEITGISVRHVLWLRKNTNKGGQINQQRSLEILQSERYVNT